MANEVVDERLEAVEKRNADMMQKVEDTYGGVQDQATDYYNQQIEANWGDKQAQFQQEQTDLTLEQIQQQQDQAEKDYTKEQSAAWTDYQKQTSQHGVNAEQMAAAGMTGTGYSESSKVGMYNAYQNRVATARESYNKAVQNYNNSMKEARLQNSSVLAEIAFNALQTELQLGLQGLQYSHQLAAEKLGLTMQAEDMRNSQWMDVMGQINTEKTQAEQIRQFDLSHQLDVDALAQKQENWQAEFDYGKTQDAQTQENWQAEFDAANAQAAQNQANWQAEFDRDNAALAKQEALDSAQIMATSGDFSGYKAALGLTDAQVKKLESKYQSEIQTEADAKAYEQKLDRAAVLAAGGDFSGYKDLYDLTDEQVKDLEEAYTTQNTGSEAILSGGDGTQNEQTNVYGLTQTEVHDRMVAIEGDLGSYDFDGGSLTKLGYGDVSDEELIELYMNGALDYTVVGGKLVFKKGKNYKDPRTTKGSSAPAVGKNAPVVRD